MAYAHALIEVPRDADNPDAGVVRYNRGDEVPSDLEGYDELVKYGSVKDEPYDPAEEPRQVPDFVEIDGVRYIKTGEGADHQEQSNGA